MDKLYITHYFYPGTDPWKNIMLLPEEEAFRKAKELADAHPDTTSFGRFADFENYYPARKNFARLKSLRTHIRILPVSAVSQTLRTIIRRERKQMLLCVRSLLS